MNDRHQKLEILLSFKSETLSPGENVVRIFPLLFRKNSTYVFTQTQRSFILDQVHIKNLSYFQSIFKGTWGFLPFGCYYSASFQKHKTQSKQVLTCLWAWCDFYPFTFGTGYKIFSIMQEDLESLHWLCSLWSCPITDVSNNSFEFPALLDKAPVIVIISKACKSSHFESASFSTFKAQISIYKAKIKWFLSLKYDCRDSIREEKDPNWPQFGCWQMRKTFLPCCFCLLIIWRQTECLLDFSNSFYNTNFHFCLGTLHPSNAKKAIYSNLIRTMLENRRINCIFPRSYPLDLLWRP